MTGRWLLFAVGIAFPRTLFGFPNDNWKEFRAPWAQDLLAAGGFNITRKGSNLHIHPEGDTTPPPSGHMPKGGYFFDTIVRQEL